MSPLNLFQIDEVSFNKHNQASSTRSPNYPSRRTPASTKTSLASKPGTSIPNHSFDLSPLPKPLTTTSKTAVNHKKNDSFLSDSKTPKISSRATPTRKSDQINKTTYNVNTYTNQISKSSKGHNISSFSNVPPSSASGTRGHQNSTTLNTTSIYATETLQTPPANKNTDNSVSSKNPISFNKEVGSTYRNFFQQFKQSKQPVSNSHANSVIGHNNSVSGHTNSISGVRSSFQEKYIKDVKKNLTNKSFTSSVKQNETKQRIKQKDNHNHSVTLNQGGMSFTSVRSKNENSGNKSHVSEALKKITASGIKTNYKGSNEKNNEAYNGFHSTRNKLNSKFIYLLLIF